MGKRKSEWLRREAVAAAFERLQSSRDPLDKIRGLLERYLSSTIARSITNRTLRDVTPEDIRRGNMEEVYRLTRRGMELFISEGDKEQALKELAELCGQARPSSPVCEVEMGSEDDVRSPDHEMLRLWEDMGKRRARMKAAGRPNPWRRDVACAHAPAPERHWWNLAEGAEPTGVSVQPDSAPYSVREPEIEQAKASRDTPSPVEIFFDLDSVDQEQIGKVLRAIELIFGSDLKVVDGSGLPPGSGGKALEHSPICYLEVGP